MKDILSAYSPSLEELKRVSRILELVQIIAVAPKRYLRRDLSKRFEISERMIQKDLMIIRHGLRLPLDHSTSGYYFEEMPRLPVLQYSFAEALALLLAVRAARQITGIRSSELAAAVARLEALFPAEFRPVLREAMNPLPVTAQREHRQEMLALLNQGLLYHRKVRILYETRSRGGETNSRTIHPYSLFPYVRSWQIVAFCELRQKALIFKVDRILGATLLDDCYEMPMDFNLEEYMGVGWGLMRGQAGSPEEVILRFKEDAGHWVAEEFWHSSQKFEPQSDGSLLLRLTIAPTPEFTNWLMYYGDKVCVLSPQWLRDKLQESHLQAANLYKTC